MSADIAAGAGWQKARLPGDDVRTRLGAALRVRDAASRSASAVGERGLSLRGLDWSLLGLRGADRRPRRHPAAGTGWAQLIGVGLIYVVFVRLIGVPLP